MRLKKYTFIEKSKKEKSYNKKLIKIEINVMFSLKYVHIYSAKTFCWKLQKKLLWKTVK